MREIHCSFTVICGGIVNGVHNVDLVNPNLKTWRCRKDAPSRTISSSRHLEATVGSCFSIICFGRAHWMGGSSLQYIVVCPSCVHRRHLGVQWPFVPRGSERFLLTMNGRRCGDLLTSNYLHPFPFFQIFFHRFDIVAGRYSVLFPVKFSSSSA